MTALRSVGHIALLTRDFARLGSFYADVFGAEVIERSSRDEELGLGFIRVGDATVLHVFERLADALGGVDDEQAMRPFTRGRIDHFSVEARDLTSFVAAKDRLFELGATDGAVTDFGPLVSVFFVDPDGSQLELSLTKTPEWNPPFQAVEFSPRERR